MNRRGFLGMLLTCVTVPLARAAGKATSTPVDAVPVCLKPGSFVVRKSMVQRYPTVDFSRQLQEAVDKAVREQLIDANREGGMFARRKE